MKMQPKMLIGAALAGLLAGCGGTAKCPEAAAKPSAYVSPENVAAAKDGGVYVTSATGQKILRVKDGKIAGSWSIAATQAAEPVPINPSGLATAPDGSVWVTAGVQCGEIQHFAADGKLLGSAAVGHWPCAPVVSADGKTLYVLNRFAAQVKEIDTATLAVKRTFKALREPFAAALAGGKLFVANMLPYCAATNDVVAASVTVIDLRDGATKHVPLANGSTGVRGICASPDGKFVYAVHTMGRYQLPTTQLERGWMNTAACSVFCGATGMYVNTFLLDDVDRGAANPWGVAVSCDGKWLCVNHAATCEMSIIDRTELHKRLEAAAKGQSVSGIVKAASDVSNDLAFLVSIRRRILLAGDGPRGLACAGGKMVAALYFADKVAVVDPCAGAASACAVGPAQDITKDRVRRGEMLYNSGTMCFQQWQSCASCHPDGRVDGLNWDLLNDGMGNPKQTKSQIYGQFTAPTMVTGIRKDMKTCNRAGLIHIQFVQRPEEDGLCLDAYTESLEPVPSPYLVNGRLSAAAERGKAVYEKATCTLCHGDQTKTPDGRSLYTDCKSYLLATKDKKTYRHAAVDNALPPEAKERGFDTPTLCEVWRSAPFLYDGRALTMREVLKEANPHDTHGVTQGLTDREIDDLAEYVLSL